MPDHPLSSRAFLALYGADSPDSGTARRMVVTAQRNAAWHEARLRERENARLELLLRRYALAAAVVIAAVVAVWSWT